MTRRGVPSSRLGLCSLWLGDRRVRLPGGAATGSLPSQHVNLIAIAICFTVSSCQSLFWALRMVAATVCRGGVLVPERAVDGVRKGRSRQSGQCLFVDLLQCSPAFLTTGDQSASRRCGKRLVPSAL